MRQKRAAPKTELPKLLAPETGRGPPPIATPQIRPRAVPGAPLLATRFGAQGPTSRKLWKFDECWNLREFQKSPKNNGGVHGVKIAPTLLRQPLGNTQS